MNSDLEDPNGTNDWKSTNSHKSELIIAYNNKARNNTLYPKVFYALYIKPNGHYSGHLIYDLSRDKIVVIMNYQPVPIPEDLIEPMNRTKSSNNKIQVDHFNIKQSTVQMDYSNNNEYESLTSNSNKDDSEDEDSDELGNSQHLDDLTLDTIVDHEDQAILTKESYNSTSVYVNGSTNIDIPIPSLSLKCLYKLQDLSLQYLHKAVITILYLHCLYGNTYTVVHLISLVHVSLQISICENILHHLYKEISTVMLLLLSLHTSL